MEIGISLGWNCTPACYGVDNKIRGTKSNGYNTCPFDEMITNYHGVINCIKDDFKDFMNDDFLKLIKSEQSIGGIVKDEILLYNTKYNFIFNHESPGHANLFATQSWEGGINHYVNDNFLKLKERYNRRIDNFKNYISLAEQGNKIIFILSRFNNDVTELKHILMEKYPNLNYDILTIRPTESVEIVKGHYKLMGLDDTSTNEEMKNL